GLLQPPPHRLGVLPPRLAAGYLGRIAPPLEVVADRPHRPGDPVLVADQVAHGPAAPQRRGDAPLLGAVGGDQGLGVTGPLVREGPSRADGAPGPIAGEGGRAAGGVRRPPAADRLLGYPEQVGDVGLGESQLAAPHRTEAQGLEDLIGQLASVWWGRGRRRV